MIRLLRQAEMLERAQGCLLGRLAGDALRSLVEFEIPGTDSTGYPQGVRELADRASWNTIGGQPTDDSETAQLLTRMLVDHGSNNLEQAGAANIFWLDSGPFDCGMTVAGGLRRRPNRAGRANGAMIRFSPLGIFGANHDPESIG